MNQSGERKTHRVSPGVNRSLRIDFRGGKILLNAGVLLLREIDERDADIPLVASRETDGEVLDNVTIRDGDAD